MVFAEWMARYAGQDVQAYHANLSREGQESESCGVFQQQVRPNYADRFIHISWENIYNLCVPEHFRLCQLRKYLEAKSAGLVRAFRIERICGE